MISKKVNLRENQLILYFLISISAILSSLLIFDKSIIIDLIGNFLILSIFIILPGFYISKKITKSNDIVLNLILGSSILVAAIIPLHAIFSYLQISFVLYLLIFVTLIILIINNKKLEANNFEISKIVTLSVCAFFLSIFLIRQSLYIPATNLDRFLVWPDSYNALAQTAEITNHGPKIFPFVASANIPLEYHWGSFSLASFISFMGNFSLVVSLFKTEFIFIGILTFSLLFITGKFIGKSNFSGIFSILIGGLTLFPTFPEFNDQIGFSRPQISATSMPQFVANLLLILSIFIIYNILNSKFMFNYSLVLFITTLSATLTKGPNGLLILILSLSLIILFKNFGQVKYIFIPSLVGFLIGYFIISSPLTTSRQSGMSLWFNPKNTLDLLIQGNNLTNSSKIILLFICLIVLSFVPFVLSIFVSFEKNIYLIPLAISAFAGILGSFLLEAWGYSQFFLLYGAIPLIGIFIASSLFYKQKTLNFSEVFFILLGFIVQPIIYNLLSSFINNESSLKLFLIWIFSILIIILITLFFSQLYKKNIVRALALSTIGIAALTGISKYDPIAYSQPEHPYSISIGTSEIAIYLKENSNVNDLIATNRHCAGIDEPQDCTARQFALTALSERRVFIEGWSYTTCPLSEAITNRYWRESDWKLNQDFFVDPQSNWQRFKKTGVDWLVVDESRPSSKDFSSVATLILRSNVVSLWKVNDPFTGDTPLQTNPCDSKSNY